MAAVKPSGLLLIIAGVWVLTQVLGGDALGRLGITSPTSGGLPPNASTPVGPIAGEAAAAAAAAAARAGNTNTGGGTARGQGQPR